jgi:hypothetical protein
MNIHHKGNYYKAGLRKMRRRLSLHTLLLGTILDFRNKLLQKKLWNLVGGVSSHLPLFPAINLTCPASNILTLKLAQKDTTLTTTI